MILINIKINPNIQYFWEAVMCLDDAKIFRFYQFPCNMTETIEVINNNRLSMQFYNYILETFKSQKEND